MTFALRDRSAGERSVDVIAQRRAADLPWVAGPSNPTQFLALQRLAGNRATSTLMAVQRCGSIPPDQCPCHDKEEAATQAPTTESANVPVGASSQA